MPKLATALKETQVKNTRPGKKSKYLFDGKGLYLEIKPIGTRLWRLKYTFDSRQRLLSMGAYPEVSLQDARERRDNARKLLADGIDPADHRKAMLRAKGIRETTSFEAIAREWHLKFKPTWAESYAFKTIRYLERDVFPWLGTRPIAEIEIPEILSILNRIQERSLGTAHIVLTRIGQIMQYACRTDRLSRDLTQDLKKALPANTGGHFAAFTDPGKFGELLRTIGFYTGGLVVRTALKLAPMLIVRPCELRSMEWEHVNLDKAEWRFLVTKTKSLHLVPLATQAVELLRVLQGLTGHGRFVFPNMRLQDGSRSMSESAIIIALRTMGYSKNEVTQHGFRASFRTIGAEVLKFRYDLMEHQLAHAVRDPLGRAYNRTEFIDERREMMQRWADYLDGLKSSVGIKVKGDKIYPLANLSKN